MSGAFWRPWSFHGDIIGVVRRRMTDSLPLFDPGKHERVSATNLRDSVFYFGWDFSHGHSSRSATRFVDGGPSLTRNCLLALTPLISISLTARCHQKKRLRTLSKIRGRSYTRIVPWLLSRDSQQRAPEARASSLWVIQSLSRTGTGGAEQRRFQLLSSLVERLPAGKK